MNNENDNEYSKFKKNLKSNVKLFNNKKIRNIAIIIISLVIIIIALLIILGNRVKKNDKNTTTYDEIVNMINDKDTFLIYYYNSKSKNKNNKEIKKYLDELGIRYFNYNDSLIKRNEYTEFLKLMEIDKSIFGVPALIYIRNGKMYGNIINIDSKEVVDKFIESYDLYTVK